MSYIINNSRGQIVAVVGDGTVNTVATDLSLIGRAVTNYGEYQNENYVYLLENFAAPGSPPQPILGQLWYNSTTDVLNSYSTGNVWVALASQNYVQAQKISPAFSGTPTAPTPTSSTNNTQIATTAFVQQNKLSPAFTGVPTAPTAPLNTANTQIATTAFVQNQLVSGFVSTNSITAAGLISTSTISAAGNIQGGNFLAGGSVASSGAISATGNLTGGNIQTNGQITAAGNISTNSGFSAIGTVTGGNISSLGFINAAGNITGDQLFINNVSVLGALNAGIEVTATGVFAANVTSNMYSGNSLSVSGNVTAGNVVSLGNVTANNIIANSVTAIGNRPFRLPNLTQTQINALSALNGDMVYNTTTNLPQIYQNGVWRNFTIAYYS